MKTVALEEFAIPEKSGGVIELLPRGNSVRDLLVPSVLVAGYLRQVSAGERARSVIEAPDVGAVALERVATTNDLAFVRAQVNEIVGSVERSIGSRRPTRRVPTEPQTVAGSSRPHRDLTMWNDPSPAAPK
jgi:hypothetical protein